MKRFLLFFCLCALLSAYSAEDAAVPASQAEPAAAPAPTASAQPQPAPANTAVGPRLRPSQTQTQTPTPSVRLVPESPTRSEPPSILTGSGGSRRPGLRHTWTGPGPSGYTPWYWWKIPPPWTPSFARDPWYWHQIPQPTPRGELTPAQAVSSPLRPEKQDIPASVRLRGSRLPASRSLPAPADTPARIRLKQYQMPSSPSRPASVPRLRSTPGGLRRR